MTRPAPLEGPRRRLLDCQGEAPERAIARGTHEVIADIGYPPEVTYPRPRPAVRLIVWLIFFAPTVVAVAGALLAWRLFR